jgi:putative tryptophan/tyrosine transport system substrate-binding protein
LKQLGVLITALWLLIPGSAWCYDLLIVLSQRSPAYDDVLRGMRSAARFSERVVVLTDYNEVDLVRIAREEKPVAIVTLGDNALAAARKARQTPVIALMALSFRAGMMGHPAMTGVEVQPSPERYLPIFGSIRARRVGIVSNATRNAVYIKNARKAAVGLGLDLVVREVKSSREVSGQLDSLAGLVDALWMLPDSVTASGEAADAHFLFSASHKIPVITFSSAYLASGAALALDIDRFDMGRQGGEMAAALVAGKGIADIPPVSPRKTTLTGNPSVLRRLGLKPDLAGSRNPE